MPTNDKISTLGCAAGPAAHYIYSQIMTRSAAIVHICKRQLTEFIRISNSEQLPCHFLSSAPYIVCVPSIIVAISRLSNFVLSFLWSWPNTLYLSEFALRCSSIARAMQKNTSHYHFMSQGLNLNQSGEHPACALPPKEKIISMQPLPYPSSSSPFPQFHPTVGSRATSATAISPPQYKPFTASGLPPTSSSSSSSYSLRRRWWLRISQNRFASWRGLRFLHQMHTKTTAQYRFRRLMLPGRLCTFTRGYAASLSADARRTVMGWTKRRVLKEGVFALGAGEGPLVGDVPVSSAPPTRPENAGCYIGGRVCCAGW